MKRGFLIDEVIDIIYEEIPLNLTCPHCEGELEVDSIMDKSSRIDQDDWARMATKVISTVSKGLAPILEDLTDQEIRNL